jgi:hypothetical protein
MKKQFFGSLVFASVFSVAFLSAENVQSVTNQENSVVALVDDSGKDRVAHIMSQIKHDIVPGNTNPISYVQVSNIDQDLNIKEIAHYFGCKTVMGNAFLKETLQRPVSPIDQSGVIALRKNAVTRLIENPDLKKQVEDILEVAAEQEKAVLDLMSNTFRGQTCPEVDGLKLMKEQKEPLYPVINFMITNPTYRTYNTISSFVMTPALWVGAGYFGYLAAKHQSGTAVLSSVYCGLIAALMTYTVYDDCAKAGQKRVKMHALNQLIHAAESIEELSVGHGIATQFKMSLIVDEQGVEIVESLKAWRYENETDYCFNIPMVHTFLYRLYENDAQLAQIFASIAEMDAYNAIATKMLETQATDRKFCFAQVIESTQPQVLSAGFWNVLVPNAVVNSLPMNKSVILTGPNAGGKTTSIRANLQNIILAQTYGIAAAEQFAYTQFDVILSYLNISDDLMNGYSLFASEIKRAKDLLEILRALTPGQKLFFALDELFTGTAAEQGEKCAYEFIKKTSEFNQALFIYATHFDKLKELGKSNIGLMNYKVDAPTKNDEGKLVYPFTVSAGASTVNIAEDMAREAGLFD